jgi:hypothetical protein
MKPTKQEAGYHLPIKGCYNCKYSYTNSYGDPACTQLDSFGCVITPGGCCRFWQEDLNVWK